MKSLNKVDRVQFFSKMNMNTTISERLDKRARINAKPLDNYSYGNPIPYRLDTFDSKDNFVDDDAPFIIASLRDKAPTHSAAINKKIKMTYGKGFNLDSIKEYQDIIDILSNLNERGENINEILRKVVDDFITFGGFALIVSYNHNGYISSINNINFINLRVCAVDEYQNPTLYLYDSLYSSQPIYGISRIRTTYPIFNPNVFSRLRSLENDRLPVLTEEEKFNCKQIIYFNSNCNKSSYNITSKYYPKPDYAAAIESIITESKVSSFNHNAITNGVTGLTILQYPSYSINPEFQNEAYDDVVNAISGADNAGRIIVHPKSKNDDEDIKLIQAEGIGPDRYIALLDSIKESIVTAHEIPSILLNIKQSTGWSNAAQEMSIAELLFQNNIIATYQETIERVFNSLLSNIHLGKVNLKIIPLLGDKDSISYIDIAIENKAYFLS